MIASRWSSGRVSRGLAEVLQIQPSVLFRVNRKAFAEQPVGVLNLATALAHLAVETRFGEL
jgi:hypothetical protein